MIYSGTFISKRIAITFIICLVQMGVSQSQTSQSILMKKVATMDGEIYTLDSLLNNKPVLMVFWATWCEPCVKELNKLMFKCKKWDAEYNLKIIAVNIDDSRSTHKIKPFVRGKRWTFMNLLDPNQELMRALGVVNVPSSILFADAEIIWTHTGYLEGNEKIMDKLFQDFFKNKSE